MGDVFNNGYHGNGITSARRTEALNFEIIFQGFRAMD